MTDRRLRDLERRWHESGDPEDRAAWLREQLRGRQGVVTEAVGFLADLADLAESKLSSAPCSEALAQVAWATAELGAPHLDLTERAELLLEREDSSPRAAIYQSCALSRTGALRARTEGPEAGRATLSRALDRVLKMQTTDPQVIGQQVLDARRVFEAWWEAMGSAPGYTSQDPLVRRATSALMTLVPNHRSFMVERTYRSVFDLGLGEWVRDRFVEALEPEALQRAHLAVAHYHNTESAYRTHVQSLLLTLARLPDGVRCPDEVREDAARLLREHSELIGEFTVEALQFLLPDWEEAERWSEELERGARPYPARLVRLAGLRKLVAEEDTRAADVLAQDFVGARSLSDPSQRNILLQNLIPLVPQAASGARAVELLRTARRRGDRGEVTFDSDLYIATTWAVAELEDTELAMGLLEEGLGLAEQVYPLVAAAPHGPFWLILEGVGVAIRAATRVGDQARAADLVQRAAALARAREDARPDAMESHFIAQLMLACGIASLGLGDTEGADRHLDDALADRNLDSFDRAELLCRAANLTRSLSLEHTLPVLRRVHEAASSLTLGPHYGVEIMTATSLAAGRLDPIPERRELRLGFRL